jgi:hypothetical protein
LKRWWYIPILKAGLGRVWWSMPVIPDTWEVEDQEDYNLKSVGQKFSENPFQQMPDHIQVAVIPARWEGVSGRTEI